MQGSRANHPKSSEFLKISALIKDVSGINLPLTDKNVMLVSSRLQKVIKRNGLNSYAELIERIQVDLDLKRQLLCALTTNTTRFFREPDHFDILAQRIGELQQKKRLTGNTELRIWSVPCSTGQEAYSLAAKLLDTDANFRILATDIDDSVLELAREGIYKGVYREEIPREHLSRHFHYDRKQDLLSVDAAVKARITWGRFNLLRNYDFKEPFDVIFCRNVLIYFDQQGIDYVTRNLLKVLNPWGLLFLGHAEAGAMRISGLKKVGPSVFMKERN